MFVRISATRIKGFGVCGLWFVQGATVIVSNVPLELTPEEISGAFACVGEVVGCELLLNSSGVHTGRVAVAFVKRAQALEAVRRFDGGDLNGKVIRVFLE